MGLIAYQAIIKNKEIFCFIFGETDAYQAIVPYQRTVNNLKCQLLIRQLLKIWGYLFFIREPSIDLYPDDDDEAEMDVAHNGTISNIHIQ